MIYEIPTSKQLVTIENWVGANYKKLAKEQREFAGIYRQDMQQGLTVIAHLNNADLDAANNVIWSGSGAKEDFISALNYVKIGVIK